MTEKKEEILEFLVSTLKETKDFVLEQAPDVVQQYLGALFIDSFTSFIFSSLACLIFGLIGAFILVKKPLKDDPDCPGANSFVGGVLTLIAGACLCLSIEFSIKSAKIHYYPKGYLLEKVLK